MRRNKIGRNDPCPCGSGKKYKKCCLGRPMAPHQIDLIPPPKQPLRRSTSNTALPGKRKRSYSAVLNKTKRKKHHYVPIWYQKGFLPQGQTSLHHMNLRPFKDLPDGRRVNLREFYEWGPGSCFYEKDLYTTRVFGHRNEEIEEYLFGKIDGEGSRAIQALIKKDYGTLSKLFTEVFGYMDAQKLRTPKGLDWIRSNYFQLSQLELMLEMQFLRTMHCTMWVEGVMEIVSAEDSDIKFIISDHPVTIYNRACSPESERCKYPNDPSTAWKGSQTIFPLDLDHCFILTNLEYARDADGVDPLTSRTNPRYFAQTITRWDKVIRERKLKPEEVSRINYIVKKRARKYIAAAKLEWLYPEKSLPTTEWPSLNQVLLPPKDQVWQFGGEIFVGGKDGKLAWHQDEFGRRFTSRETADDPIRKYPIKERNRILYNAIFEIFGFSKGKDWDDFRRELTDDKIKELYGVVGGLWNPDTEIMNLMPKPSNGLSAFYSGTIDPRVIPITVLGYSLYVDRIILISPFLNPRVMNPEYSPYDSPSQYKSDAIKNVLTMVQLKPLIEAGIVEMIPDPCDFDPYFRKRIYKMAEARVKGRMPDQKDMDHSEKLMREDLERSFLSLSSDLLKHQIRKAIPNIKEEDVEKTVKYIERQRLSDPLSLLQPMEPGKSDGQLQISRMGGNLEMALYLAQATGSFLYTDVRYRWKEVHSAILKRPVEDGHDPWAPLVKALDNVPLTMFVHTDPRFSCLIKEKGTLKDFTNLYRNILTSVRDIKESGKALSRAEELAGIIKSIDMKSIWDSITKDYEEFLREHSERAPLDKVNVPASHLIPADGLGSNTVTQILLTHGSNTPYWGAVPFGVFLDLQNSKSIE